MNTVELASWVEDYIIDHMKMISQPHYEIIPAEHWHKFRDELQWRYGWTYPSTAAFCPSVIAGQIEHLDEEDREHYLDVILFMFDRYVVHAHENPDWDARQVIHACENDVVRLGEGSLDLVNEVELHALDEEL